MRDEQCGATFHHFAQVAEDLVFSVRVHAGQRVIQYQNAWIADDGARNRRALLLSTTESYAALADNGLILLGKFFNLHSDAGSVCGSANVLHGGSFHTEGNVLANG